MAEQSTRASFHDEALGAAEPGALPRREGEDRAVGDAGAGCRSQGGQEGQNRPEVVEFTDERRGSSVAEQLIRKHPRVPTDSTQPDATAGNQTQQP
jgi:hypothetical protein